MPKHDRYVNCQFCPNGIQVLASSVADFGRALRRVGWEWQGGKATCRRSICQRKLQLTNEIASGKVPILNHDPLKGGDNMATDTKTAKARTKKTAPKTKAQKCSDGCGGMTKGGRFLPGHDAKLKSRLIGSAASGSAKAVDELKKLGWERYIPKPAASTNGSTKKASTKAKATA